MELAGATLTNWGQNLAFLAPGHPSGAGRGHRLSPRLPERCEGPGPPCAPRAAPRSCWASFDGHGQTRAPRLLLPPLPLSPPLPSPPPQIRRSSPGRVRPGAAGHMAVGGAGAGDAWGSPVGVGALPLRAVKLNNQ